MKESKICPRCKTENPKVANFCRRCRYKFPEGTKDGTSLSPIIHSFKIQENDYTVGSVIHFEWFVENANIIKLNDCDVTSNGNAETKVEKAETIVLAAENDYDKAERSIRLSPRPLPSIRSFSSSYSSIRSGQGIKLKWDFKNAAKAVFITSDGDINVTNKSFIKVTPTKTETYRLVCYSCDDNIFVEQSLQVTVASPVVIHNFTADKDLIAESDKVTLKWDVEHATSIMLHPIMKDVTKLKKIEVNPSRTTEYRLVASNNISQDEQSLSVGVRQLPKMDVKFADSLSKLEIPSFNIDLSFLHDSLKNAKIDEWMTMKPLKEIKLSVRINTLIASVKSIFEQIRKKR